MDNLEKFISGNREQFDGETPSVSVWDTIEKELDEEHRLVAGVRSWQKPIYFYLRRAAAVFLLLLAGAGIGRYYTDHSIGNIVSSAAKTDGTNNSLDNTEAFYAKKVNQKVELLEKYSPDPSVIEDLQQIDAVQLDLRRELENAPLSSREEIIGTMIKNYENKLDILERVLQRIQENAPNLNDSINLKHPKNDTI
jgi:hypothetical protein